MSRKSTLFGYNVVSLVDLMSPGRCKGVGERGPTMLLYIVVSVISVTRGPVSVPNPCLVKSAKVIWYHIILITHASPRRV